MKIFRNINNFNATKPVLTIGTFDGVHLGHEKVISELKRISQEVGGESVVLTFYPHPRKVLGKGDVDLLNTIDEKVELLEKKGIDNLIIYPFTKEFSKLSYIEFIETILIQQLNINYLVLGYDNKFGHNREGELKYLKEKNYDFNIIQLDPLFVDEVNISSTKIRNLIAIGDIENANKFLGYPYSISGDVVKGKKIGRKIGFPTANIELIEKNKLAPANGVYAVKVLFEEVEYKGMLNIGIRPTVNNQLSNKTIEVNIFDFDQDIYYKSLTIKMFKKVREEQCFDSLEALKAQIEKDKYNIIELFKKFE